MASCSGEEAEVSSVSASVAAVILSLLRIRLRLPAGLSADSGTEDHRKESKIIAFPVACTDRHVLNFLLFTFI